MGLYHLLGVEAFPAIFVAYFQVEKQLNNVPQLLLECSSLSVNGIVPHQ